MKQLLSRAACVHEAAHAVARLHVGSSATPTVVHEDGTGLSHGQGRWKSAHTGQYALWNLLVVMLAGGLAEARVRKKSAPWIFLTTAREDWSEASRLLTSLVDRGLADNFDGAYLRAEEETRLMLKACWWTILRVSEALQERGALSPEQLVSMVGETPQGEA